MKRFLIVALATGVIWGCKSGEAAPSGLGNPTTPTTPTAVVTLGTGTVTAEIASTTVARDSGLMGRTSLATNAGMLFVYQDDQSNLLVGFWMRDTPVPLSIAFLDSTKRVISVADMTPNTDTVHVAAAPFRYALEVNQGWLAAHGVTAGTAVSFTLPAGTVISP